MKIRSTKKLTLESFIKKANIIHNNKFKYNNSVYINNKTQLIITCPIHGDFLQRPDNHLHGYGCNECSGRKKMINESFILKALNIHGEEYKYDNVNYIDNHTKVEIICKIHGSFYQKPNSHLNGEGCPECYGSKKHTFESFIEKANLIHDSFYDYSKVIYINNKAKIEIICPKHGSFWQRPDQHFFGRGCPICNKLGVSKMEKLFLNKIGISEENRQKRILRYNIDGYDPITNTIYEFLGNYWHGNPVVYNPTDINPHRNLTFHRLYIETFERFDLFRQLGYTVKYVWESDWVKFNKGIDKELVINNY